MKKMFLLPLVAMVCGCGIFPASMRQALPVTKESLSQAIPPGAGISGRAGRVQDSLRTRLEWLAARLAKNGPLVERLAFAGETDDSLRLELELTDANGWNTHHKSPQDVACLEARRWVKVELDWPKQRKEAGLSAWPLNGTLAYRGHDVQRGRADWNWDTLSFAVTDSLRWQYRGQPLPCSAKR